jgi:hypothetical protein
MAGISPGESRLLGLVTAYPQSNLIVGEKGALPLALRIEEAEGDIYEAFPTGFGKECCARFAGSELTLPSITRPSLSR